MSRRDRCIFRPSDIICSDTSTISPGFIFAGESTAFSITAGQPGSTNEIRNALGREPENYVAGMFNAQHLNGLAFQEYRVTEFTQAADVEVLSFSRSSEGRELFSEQIAAEVRDVPYEDLVGHGFELVFRRK